MFLGRFLRFLNTLVNPPIAVPVPNVKRLNPFAKLSMALAASLASVPPPTRAKASIKPSPITPEFMVQNGIEPVFEGPQATGGTVYQYSQFAFPILPTQAVGLHKWLARLSCIQLLYLVSFCSRFLIN